MHFSHLIARSWVRIATTINSLKIEFSFGKSNSIAELKLVLGSIFFSHVFALIIAFRSSANFCLVTMGIQESFLPYAKVRKKGKFLANAWPPWGTYMTEQKKRGANLVWLPAFSPTYLHNKESREMPSLLYVANTAFTLSQIHSGINSDKWPPLMTLGWGLSHKAPTTLRFS